MDINSLPVEILPHIFKHLCLNDRKNVRLSCRDWNLSCNVTEIVTHEKFVFYGRYDYDKPDFVSRIEKCRSYRSTVEFYGLPLDTMPVAVWRKIGLFAETLFIYGGDLDSGLTIKNIILYCSELKNLCIVSHSTVERSLHQWEVILDGVIEARVRRECLVYFRLFFQLYHPRDSIFQKFFKIYPNIRTFKRGFIANDTWSKSLELPPLADKMELWSADPRNNKCLTNSWLKPFCSDRSGKFKEFASHLKLRSEDTDIIFDFFSKQTELETVTIEIPNADETLLKALVLFILDNLPKLKHLSFCVPTVFLHFTEEETRRFLKGISRLESLMLYFLDVDLKCTISELPLVFTKLKVLKLGLRLRFLWHTYFTIIKRCPVLKWLHISCVPRAAVTQIFTYFTNLERLYVECGEFTLVELYSDPGLGGQFTAADLFQKLNNFELRVNKHDFRRYVTFLSKFEFPNLKYFHMGLRFHHVHELWSGIFLSIPRNQMTSELLVMVANKMPYLEILKTCYVLQLEEMLPYFARMKYLKFFIAADVFSALACRLTKPMVEGLFRVCSSLTFIMDDAYCYARNDLNDEGFLERDTSYYLSRLDNNYMRNIFFQGLRNPFD